MRISIIDAERYTDDYCMPLTSPSRAECIRQAIEDARKDDSQGDTVITAEDCVVAVVSRRLSPAGPEGAHRLAARVMQFPDDAATPAGATIPDEDRYAAHDALRYLAGIGMGVPDNRKASVVAELAGIIGEVRNNDWYRFTGSV
jgi:hypothetical protein